jgi:hypothetical protein
MRRTFCSRADSKLIPKAVSPSRSGALLGADLGKKPLEAGLARVVDVRHGRGDAGWTSPISRRISCATAR